MSPALASELSDTTVMSTDGQHVGELYTLTFDADTGDLATLVVETDRSQVFGIRERDDGLIHLPATVLKDVRDQLIITPPAQHE